MKDAVSRQLPQTGDPAARLRAERFFQDGEIVSVRFGTLRFEGGKIWSETGKRAQARYVHGFLFLSDWHGTVLRDPELRADYAALAVDVLHQWSAKYADGANIPEVAHHDETTAQRLIQLTALLISVQDIVSRDDYNWLADLAGNTARLLATDDFHATGNNHGMFQDIALLYFSVMCDFVPSREREHFFVTATDRLYAYFSSSFTAEGVHIENTPTYHLMVSKYVHNVLDILSKVGHPHADYYNSLLQNAAEYATHALMPNGMYPPISDTTQQLETGAARQNIFKSDEFAFAASAGKLGSQPQRRTLVLPASGYAIYRSSWTDPDATFAFFSAAYNANYHKHSDDLAFFLRSAGVDLLSEAGAYGYDYKDPLTKYAYSSFAHNCVIVDGASLPRTDDLSHRTTMKQQDIRDEGFRVTGSTGRLKDTVHTREVDITEPGGVPRIDITDTVVSTGTHTYDLLWNLGPEVEPVIHGQGFELFHAGRKVMDLHFEADVATTVSLHHGETTPKYLGWRFPRFGEVLAVPTVRIRFEGSNATLKTRIRLADFTYLDRGLSGANSGWRRTQGGQNLNYLAVAAKTAEGTKRLAVVFSAIHQPGDFTYNYKHSLDPTGVNALYILDDFGDQGAYYLADHGNRSIFDAVQALIKSELLRLGLDATDLITAGSSKGGTAAILHGAAAGAGQIIVGAPQVSIGTFLKEPHPNILRFITGSASSEAAECLDELVFRAVDSLGSQTEMSIVVGDKDHHYRHHVRPLHEYAKSRNVAIDLTVLPGLPHSEIGSVYKNFLTQRVEHELAGLSTNGPIDYADVVGAKGTVTVSVISRSGTEIAFRLYRGSEMVAKWPYSSQTTAFWSGLEPGKYRSRVYYRNTEDGTLEAFTTKWVDVI
jgi:hypothetical protein